MPRFGCLKYPSYSEVSQRRYLQAVPLFEAFFVVIFSIWIGSLQPVKQATNRPAERAAGHPLLL